MNRLEIFDAITEERERQTEQWGDQWATGRIEPAIKLAILAEEVGEVAKEVLDAPKTKPETERLRLELVQVAAVATAWLESLEVRA